MEVFQTIINYVLNLGSAIFVPLIILILGLLAGMKLKKAFMSALTLGIAFSGMSMVIGYMSNAVSPASEALAKNTGISLPALDLGWTGAASITWSWSYAFIFFAVTIGVNFVLLLFNWTKTLNVDMWNVWGKALTAILLVPVFIGYAIILPGNQVLPLAGIINYSIAVGGLLLTGGNLARMLILGILTMPIYLYGATYLAPILSDLAEKSGAVEGIKKGQLITWSSIEGPEFRILFAEAFNRNILAIVGCVIFLGLFVLLYKYMIKAKVPSERYAELQK
ncbi:PTS transporter subunit IIC [Enterococcus faecium]